MPGIPSALDTGKSMLTDALSSFWGSGTDTGKIKNPYQTPASMGGAGMDARRFVEGLMKNATYVRYESDKAGAPLKDAYKRTLAYAIIGTPQGEINVQAELIRSGFSTDWQAFGKSSTYGDVYASAQAEAVAAHRGPMWGGGPPVGVHYQTPTADVAARTITSVNAADAQLVDADTFNLGPMFGEVRLSGVNAPEMTTWEGVDKGNYFSKADELRSTGHGVKAEKGEGWQALWSSIDQLSDPRRKPSWYGIRKSFPTNPGQFEGMKTHPEAGFPGGREQLYDEFLSKYVHGLEEVLSKRGITAATTNYENKIISRGISVSKDSFGLSAGRGAGETYTVGGSLYKGDRHIGKINRDFFFGGSEWNRDPFVQLQDIETGGGTGLVTPLYRFESEFFGKSGLDVRSTIVSDVTKAKADQFYKGANWNREKPWAKLGRGGSWGLDWKSPLKGIRPETGGHAPWMPKTDVMKPHPEIGFPGGREDQVWTGTAHHWYVDVETQGLGTSSETKGLFRGRGSGGRLRISQFAAIKVDPNGVRSETSVYTNLINRRSLAKHGVTAERLASGEALPSSFIRHLRRKGYDPSVAEIGSVLDVGVRRHAAHVLGGGPVVREKDLYQQIGDEWKSIAGKGGKVEFHAWNVGYDFRTVLNEMNRRGHGGAVGDLLRTDSLIPREMMERSHALLFDHMMRTNHVPVMTDRAMIQSAAGNQLKNVTFSEGKRLGLIQEHTGLRNMMNDVREGGRTGIERRARSWLESKNLSGHPVVERQVSALVDKFSQVRDWNTYQRFSQAAHQGRGAAHPVTGMTDYSMMGEIYAHPGQEHAHVLGSISRTGENQFTEGLSRGALSGTTTGFNYTLGNRLEDAGHAMLSYYDKPPTTGSHLIDGQDSLRLSSENAEYVRSKIGQHEGLADIKAAMIIEDHQRLIQKDTALNQRWGEHLEATHEVRTANRVGGLLQDARRHGAGVEDIAARAAANGGGQALTERAVNKAAGHGGPNWATWAFGAAALWMISENNRVDKTPIAIEGQRRSQSWYNSIPGINPSELPFSNISAFHSGYDTFDVMSQTAPDGSPASPPMTGQLEAIEGSRNYYQNDYTLPQTSFARNTAPPLPADVGLSGLQNHWDMSDAQGAGFRAAHSFMSPPMGPRMRMNDAQNVEVLMSAGNPSPAREYLLQTFNAMGSGEDVDIGGEISRIPLGYSGARTGRFRSTGHAGYVQQLGENAMSSKIRDHATQLRRLPGMPVTTQGQDAISGDSHAEMEAFSESMGDGG